MPREKSEKQKLLVSLTPKAIDLLRGLEAKRGLEMPSAGIEALIINFAPLLLDDELEVIIREYIKKKFS